jgi:REP element-mobilizing transposase RayT
VEQPLRKRLDHKTPHWVNEAPIYFITVCAEPRKKNHFCVPALSPEILRSIRFYHEKEDWFCHLAVLMPDHVHLLLSFPDVSAFSEIIGNWKRWLNVNRSIHWQENFFEHRLRDDEIFAQKADYILQNPVRAGLIGNAKDWAYTWMPEK